MPADEPHYRPGWLEQLPVELARWEQQGLISPEQAQAIRTLYPAPERTRSRLGAALSVMAAILIGLGVILFVAAHWEQIDRWLKVAFLLAVMLLSYGLGYWLAFGSAAYPRTGRALLLLGALIYGANIWLVAQIFHLSAHFPNGFLLWAGGTLLLAWAAQEELALVLAVVLLAIWSGGEQLGFEHLNLWFPLLTAGLVLPLAWQLRSRAAVLLSLLSVGLWLGFSAAVRFGAGHPAFGVQGRSVLILAWMCLALWGVAVYALAGVAPEWARGAQGAAGGVLALLGLFGLSFADLLTRAELPTASLGWRAALAAVLLLVLALGAAWRLWLRQPWFGAGAAAVALATASLWLLPPSPWLALLTNLALLAGIGGLLADGYSNRSGGRIALALIGFAAEVIGRYVDFFWRTMDRSLFFMAGGVLLLLLAWLLERSRRRLLGGVASDA